MSEREYLIAKAERAMSLTEERKAAARQTRKDPAFWGATAAGMGASGAAGVGLYRHMDAIDNAEAAARREGKKGWQAIKPALKKLPTKYKVAAGIGGAGVVAQQVRSDQIRRRVRGE